MPKSPSLELLRASLDELDSEMMMIAKKRLDVVEKIAVLKGREGRPILDRKREQRVLQKARERAQEVGISPMLGEALSQALIDASHVLQESIINNFGLSSQSRKFLIVGGAGQMGQRFCAAFESRGHQVDVLEIGEPLKPLRIHRADIVMLSVPMTAAPEVARSIAPLLREDALICDLNSLKQEICEIFAAHFPGQILGMHPMFGPSVQTFRRQKIVLCPVRRGPLTEWLTQELEHLGLEHIEATPEEHDRTMAAVQVLMHFSTIAMGESLRRSGVSIKKSLRFTSPIYRLELSLIGRIFAQSPTLYAEIEMQNPYALEFLQNYQDSVSSLHQIISSGDRAEFSQFFLCLSEYFSEFAENAMELSSFLINKLIERA